MKLRNFESFDLDFFSNWEVRAKDSLPRLTGFSHDAAGFGRSATWRPNHSQITATQPFFASSCNTPLGKTLRDDIKKRMCTTLDKPKE